MIVCFKFVCICGLPKIIRFSSFGFDDLYPYNLFAHLTIDGKVAWNKDPKPENGNPVICTIRKSGAFPDAVILSAFKHSLCQKTTG